MPEIGQRGDVERGEIGPDYGSVVGPQLIPRRVDLSIARADPVVVEMAGRFIWVPDSSSAGAVVNVFFNEPTGQPIPFARGAVISGVPFHKIWIQNAAQGAGSYVLLAVSQTIISIENATAQLAATLTISSTFTTNKIALNNGAATLISAQSTSKRLVKIQADRANTVNMQLGDNTVNANGYGELAAGDSDEWETTAAIYAFVAAAAQNVRVTEFF